MSIVAEPTFTVEPVVAATSGLSFPGNVDWNGPNPGEESPTIMFGWNESVLGTGAPMAAYPATYIWKAYPRANEGWQTYLFNAKWETSWTQDTSSEYYGCHPYQDGWATPLTPDPPQWEVSHYGGDTYSSAGVVSYNQWYTQVVVAYQDSQEHVRYYYDWETDESDVVSGDHTLVPAPSNPCIVVGDAPWNQGFENPNAILRGYQFYDGIAMTAQQINDSLADPDAVQTPWYLNLNPTPTDISDKSGSGNDPDWLNVNRPSLWTL